MIYARAFNNYHTMKDFLKNNLSQDDFVLVSVQANDGMGAMTWTVTYTANFERYA